MSSRHFHIEMITHEDGRSGVRPLSCKEVGCPDDLPTPVRIAIVPAPKKPTRKKGK